MENSRKKFRFVIMGAGNVSHRFYHAVGSMETCEVTAVASKSLEKAQIFAEKHGGIAAYGSYEEMLIKEQPDAVYIGTVPSFHYELTMLCLDYRIPVLCEKAMFLNHEEADAVFRRAEQEQVFVMEGLWSRFLPAVRQAKEWIAEGRIGEIRDVQVQTVWGETGVDVTTHVSLRYDDAIASLSTSFETPLRECMTIYGEHGVIEVIQPHMANTSVLYDVNRKETARFTDETGTDGFVYQIQEVIDCVRAGKYESETVSYRCTLDCAALFDLVEKTR